MKFCPKCQQQLADNMRFCIKCGTRVDSVQPQANGYSQPVAPRPQAPMYQQPMNRQVPMYQQPMNRQAPMYQQPMNRQAPMYQQPMNRQASMYQQPMNRQAPMYQQPMNRQVPMYQQPIQPINQPMTFTSDSVSDISIQQNSSSKPVAEESVAEAPVFIPEPVAEEPVAEAPVFIPEPVAEEPDFVAPTPVFQPMSAFDFDPDKTVGLYDAPIPTSYNQPQAVVPESLKGDHNNTYESYMSEKQPEQLTEQNENLSSMFSPDFDPDATVSVFGDNTPAYAPLPNIYEKQEPQRPVQQHTKKGLFSNLFKKGKKG